jgi:dTDP-4-dehydrorhamnose reductase
MSSDLISPEIVKGWRLVDTFIYLRHLSGTYHMTAAGQTTWCDFANAILQQAEAMSRRLPWLGAATHGRELIAKRVLPITSEEFRSPTRRPVYSVLSNSRLTQTFGVALADWRNQLQRCIVSEAITSGLLPS